MAFASIYPHKILLHNNLYTLIFRRTGYYTKLQKHWLYTNTITTTGTITGTLQTFQVFFSKPWDFFEKSQKTLRLAKKPWEVEETSKIDYSQLYKKIYTKTQYATNIYTIYTNVLSCKLLLPFLLKLGLHQLASIDSKE